MEEYGFGAARITVIVAAVGLIGGGALWGLAKAHLVPGYLAGVGAALAYILLLRYQMNKAGCLPREKALAYLKGSWAPRFFLITAIVLYCLHIPEIKMIALIAGLFIPFRLVVLINSISLIYREYSYKGVSDRHAI